MSAWGQPYDQATCEDALNACVARLRRNLRAIAQQAGVQSPQLTAIPRAGFRLETASLWAAGAYNAPPGEPDPPG